MKTLNKDALINWITVLILVLMCSLRTQAQDKSANVLPIADDLILFASGNPQPWETRTMGVRGGKCEN